MEQLRQLVVAMGRREEVGFASCSGGEDDARDARESSPQLGRRLRGGKVTGRKDMGHTETGREESGRTEKGGKTKGAKETGGEEAGAKETGGKATGANENVKKKLMGGNAT